jgi:hypothetical protein
MRPERVVMFASLLVIGSAARSHHAFTALYDASRTVTVEGVVSAFHLVNPHTSMTLDAVDANGNPVVWTIEFDSRVKLADAGWDELTIRPGTHVTVVGNPTRADSTKLFFSRLTFDDGRELVRPYLERLERIRAERKRRAGQQD